MKKLVYIILILFSSSCHPVVCRWNIGYKQLNKEPARSNLVGFYELNNKSKEFLNETYTEWPLKLELNKDGYYNFINSRGVKTGRWSVSCDESYGCLLELERISVEPLSTKDGKIAIQITIGDGDHCEGIIYEKIVD